MFEQSILAGHSAHRGFGFVLSLGAQMGLLGFVILIPLIYTQHLPFFPLSTPLTVPAAPPAPVPHTAVVRRSTARTPAAVPIFVMPRAIPKTIASIVEAPAGIAIPAAAPGVVGGTGDSSALDSLRALTAKPAPPPRPEPAHKAAADQPQRVSRGVQDAKLIRRVVPLYPTVALQARVSGVVHLVGIIAKDGTIRNLEVVSGNPLLVRAALDAVRQWVYQPTLLSGEPVEVICPIDVNFTLR
jgi:protein TonB